MTRFTQVAEGPVPAPSIDSGFFVEMMREGLGIARDLHKQGLQVTEKHHPHRVDKSTNADPVVQEFYFNALRKRYPDATIICEEEGESCYHRGPCGDRFRFVVDAIDGTGAFINGRFDQACSMLSLVVNDVPIATYIGLMQTEDVVGRAPDLDGLHRITASGDRTPIQQREFASKNPFMGYPLLRRPADSYSKEARRLISKYKRRPLNYRGSLGVWVVNFVTGEFRLGALPADSRITPWDYTPTYDMLSAAGYSFFYWNGIRFERHRPVLPVTSEDHGQELFFVPKDDLSSVLKRINRA